MVRRLLINFENTVIVVSHDRHFLNNVCTHIADLDFGKIKLYVGNYDFWYQSSQLAQKWHKNKIRKRRKMKELQDFIARSQQMLLNLNRQQVVETIRKIELDDIQPSSRRYPYVKFT